MFESESESEVAQSCLTLCDPMDSSLHQAPPSMGFSRQEYWSGLSFPSPSVQFSRSVVSDSLWPHESQHIRPPCPSPTPRACSNSCPLSWWCHPTISFSVVPFSSCLQSFPASGSFPISQLNGNPLQYSCLENPMDVGAWCRLLSMGSQRVGHDWATSLHFMDSKTQYLKDVTYYQINL